jgi:hypothetical protein
MTRVSSIMRHLPAGSTHPDCVFPQLAGSYLSQVRRGGAACVPAARGVGRRRLAALRLPLLVHTPTTSWRPLPDHAT